MIINVICGSNKVGNIQKTRHSGRREEITRNMFLVDSINSFIQFMIDQVDNKTTKRELKINK